MITQVVQVMLRDMKEDLRGADPLGAEMCASSAIDMWTSAQQGLLGLEGVDEYELARAMIRRLGAMSGAKTRADAVALLSAVAAMTPTDVSKLCRQQITRLERAGSRAPAWAGTIGAPSVTTALKARDVWGDQESYYIEFHYPQQDQHTLVVLIDHNLGGIVKDAFVAGTLDDVRESLRMAHAIEGESELYAIVEVDPVEAGTGILKALGRLDAVWNPPTYGDLPRSKALLRSRALHLVTGRGTEHAHIEPEDAWMDDDDRERIVARFIAAPEARRLPAIAAKAGTDASIAARWVVDFACDHSPDETFRFSPTVAEILLTHWLPRKIQLDDATQGIMVEVIRTWARFCGRKLKLPRRAIAESLDAVDLYGEQLADAMADPSSFGPAKRMMIAMREAGVDITDQSSIDEWLTEFNARDPEERFAVLGNPAPITL